jgi:2-polyprenyl-3-methyl-5-hydroxy-6-metoxy-1,4-benzoquinol methylase
MENKSKISCPLCDEESILETLSGTLHRRYIRCRQCELIFVHPKDLISKAAEKKRYLEHNNGIQFPGYVAFLSKAVEPALKVLLPNMKGLDYGCGPNPTLSILMERQGFSCDNYDPFFFPALPQGTYDFIFATECFEHFHSPKAALEHICSLLKPGGFLIVMTEPWPTVEDFKSWYYLNDVTHVSFYHTATFEFICREYGFIRHETDNRRVFLLEKTI